ncbi:MAG: DUF1598 domain-containing protein [Pirellulales bacterium]|nr:DUF1598 domain-containing protein [Pirellulales bacterium]
MGRIPVAVCRILCVCSIVIGESALLAQQATLTTQQTQATLTTQQAQTTQTTQSSQTTQTTTSQTTSPQTSVVNTNGAAGVVIDAQGIVRTEFFPDHTGQLMRQRLAAARAVLSANNPRVAKPSPLRKISLNRLEKAIGERIAGALDVPEEMKYLAGLTRVEYVFFYPETKDIVIAGPAEGWMPDLSGRVRGINSLRPIVELDDLVTALRAFPPAKKKATLISCSIDPTPEGLQRMQSFLRSYRPSSPNEEQYIVTKLKESLGMQTVRITGVPASTHFAQVLVEADYRMKLIGIGLERPPLRKFASYVDRASGGSLSKLQRWFFVPDYQCVRVADDQNAMQLIGDGVKLVGADELVHADGSRAKSRAVDAASKTFTESFTKRFSELAAVSPVYAQLRNCIDLAVAAAFIQDRDFYDAADWSMPIFGDEASFKVETLNPVKQVESAVNSVWKGNRLVTPIGGGVEISPRTALKAENLLTDEKSEVQKAHQSADISKLPQDQWWWD